MKSMPVMRLKLFQGCVEDQIVTGMLHAKRVLGEGHLEENGIVADRGILLVAAAVVVIVGRVLVRRVLVDDGNAPVLIDDGDSHQCSDDQNADGQKNIVNISLQKPCTAAKNFS